MFTNDTYIMLCLAVMRSDMVTSLYHISSINIACGTYIYTTL